MPCGAHAEHTRTAFEQVVLVARVWRHASNVVNSANALTRACPAQEASEGGNLRLARKRIRRETSFSTTYRSDHRVDARSARARGRAAQSRTGRERAVLVAANEDTVVPGTRFSAKSMAAQASILDSQRPSADFSSAHRVRLQLGAGQGTTTRPALAGDLFPPIYFCGRNNTSSFLLL